MIVRYYQVNSRVWNTKYFPICCNEFKKEISKFGKYVVIDADKQEFFLVTRNKSKELLSECPFCNEKIEFKKQDPEDKEYKDYEVKVEPKIEIKEDGMTEEERKELIDNIQNMMDSTSDPLATE